MLIAINYHYVRPNFDTLIPVSAAFGRRHWDGIHGVTPIELESQLSLLRSTGEFVTADQVRMAVLGEAALPERAFLVTFDDGLREQFDYALPVLERTAIPAVFFVNTGPVVSGTVAAVHKLHCVRASVPAAEFAALLEAATPVAATALTRSDLAVAEQYPYDEPDAAKLKYFLNFQLDTQERDRVVSYCFREVFGDAERAMSEALYMGVPEFRTLARKGLLGSHTHHHLPLGLVPVETARNEIRLSIDHLYSWTSTRVTAMSYPYGSLAACSREVAVTAQRLGIVYAFTMERAGNADLAAPLHLARFDCNDLPGGRHPRFDVDTLFATVPAARWVRPGD